MSFVLDSSVSLSWCFEDEYTQATDLLLSRVAESGAVASALWSLEVLNGLSVAQRRGRITGDARQRLVSFLRDLPVTIDEHMTDYVWTATNQLSLRFGLTTYDATYLELAQRLGLPLASLDKELRAAGAASGVTLLGV